MKYSRETTASAQTVVDFIKRYSNKKLTWFQITTLSFWPLDVGMYYAEKGRYLYLRGNENTGEGGINTPERHFRLKVTDKKDGAILSGKWCLSDFLIFFLVGLLLFGGFFIKKLVSAPNFWLLYLKDYLFSCICYLLICWLPLSLIGIFAFRKNERLLIERLDKILERIEDGEIQK